MHTHHACRPYGRRARPGKQARMGKRMRISPRRIAGGRAGPVSLLRAGKEMNRRSLAGQWNPARARWMDEREKRDTNRDRGRIRPRNKSGGHSRHGQATCCGIMLRRRESKKGAGGIVAQASAHMPADAVIVGADGAGAAK